MTEHTIDIVYTVGSLALAYLLKIIPILALIAAAAKILGLNVPPRLTRWLAWSVLPVLSFQFFQKYFLCDFTAYYYAGQDVLAGRDPYLQQYGPWRSPFLYSPHEPAVCRGIVRAAVPLVGNRLGRAEHAGDSRIGGVLSPRSEPPGGDRREAHSSRSDGRAHGGRRAQHRVADGARVRPAPCRTGCVDHGRARSPGLETAGARRPAFGASDGQAPDHAAVSSAVRTRSTSAPG